MRKSEHPVLKIDDLSMVFGGLRAIDHVSIEIRKGEIAALIGPNGAGKTTLFNCVTGVYRPTEGRIAIADPRAALLPAGERPAAGGEGAAFTGSGSVPATATGPKELFIHSRKPHEINRLGLARTFQNIRLFANMTVLENVMLGRNNSLKAGVLGALLRTKATRHEEERVIHESRALLATLGLERYANEMATNLPYGAQRRLEIARALATDPFLLLLDEPAAGMNPHETKELEETISIIREKEGVTILLIEHDMSLVMNVSEWIHVVEYGRLIAEGTPAEIRANPAVIKAYLGE